MCGQLNLDKLNKIDDASTIEHNEQAWYETYFCEYYMMTSSNGNIFRVTGHLCGEFTGPGEFPTQRPVTQSFDVFFDLRLNKRLSKQWWGWWFESLSCLLWRHRNELAMCCDISRDLVIHFANNVACSSDVFEIVNKHRSFENACLNLMAALCSITICSHFYWRGLTLIPAWITLPEKCGMKLLIHS